MSTGSKGHPQQHTRTSRFINLLFGIAVLLPLLLTSACGGSNGPGSGAGNTVLKEFKSGGPLRPGSFTVPDAWALQATCTATDTQPNGYSNARLIVTIGGDLVSLGEVIFSCIATQRTSSYAFHQGGVINPIIEAQYVDYDIKIIAGS
jgi:hypothetical protein